MRHPKTTLINTNFLYVWDQLSGALWKTSLFWGARRVILTLLSLAKSGKHSSDVIVTTRTLLSKTSCWSKLQRLKASVLEWQLFRTQYLQLCSNFLHVLLPSASARRKKALSILHCCDALRLINFCLELSMLNLLKYFMLETKMVIMTDFYSVLATRIQ